MKSEETSKWKMAILIAGMVVIIGGAFYLIGPIPLHP